MIEVDRSTGLVRVGGGTVLADLNRELDRLGLAMANLGDIDRQTISGAISTGTHGTGADLPNIPAQVEAIDLLGADGEVRRLNPTDTPDLLRAARVGVGSLGVITAVTLRTVPVVQPPPGRRADAAGRRSRRLRPAGRGERALRVLHLPPHRDGADHPAQPDRPAPPAPRGRFERYLSDVVIENGLGNLALKATGRVPAAIPARPGSRSKFMAQAEQVDVSHRCLRQLPDDPLHRDGVRAAA